LEVPSIRVLVVEDEVLIQDLLQDQLEEGGFKVEIAKSGEEAIKMLDAEGAEYRALVTDINLGRERITGWAVAKHAREITAELPVVYMTGDSGHHWASEGVPNSVLITKPFAPAQIVTAVAHLLNSGTASLGV
jgi:CheY-like chemotaxis protein